MVDRNNLIQVESTRDKDTFYVHWNIGKRCNYDCSYCPENLHDFVSPHRDLDNLKNIADKIEKHSPRKKVRIWFTGGEPTVNPNFLELVKYIKSKANFLVGLNTNASRTKDYLLDLMDHIDILQFSSHFEYIDTQEFKQKMFAMKTKCMEIPSKSFSLNLMMEPEHWDKAVDLVKYCEANEITYFMKRIRPKTGTKDPARQYSPRYTQDQIKFLTNTEFRHAILEDEYET